MAQVDFSNAVLDVSSGYPLSTRYLVFDDFYALLNSSSYAISSTVSKTYLVNTPTKVSILFTGNFTTSGTEFYMGSNSLKWRVSNIVFDSYDDFSFVIDIETSGNT